MDHQRYELCVLGAARIKRLFLLLGCGFLIVWILFGSYDVPGTPAPLVTNGRPRRQKGSLLRKLLETQEEFDPNGTNEDIGVSMPRLRRLIHNSVHVY